MYLLRLRDLRPESLLYVPYLRPTHRPAGRHQLISYGAMPRKTLISYRSAPFLQPSVLYIDIHRTSDRTYFGQAHNGGHVLWFGGPPSHRLRQMVPWSKPESRIPVRTSRTLLEFASMASLSMIPPSLRSTICHVCVAIMKSVSMQHDAKRM